MKKITIIAIITCIALMLAVPAMAMDVETDGYIRVRGFSETGYGLDDALQSTSSYYDMRLRVNNRFMVSDNVRVTTRFRAFNRTMGTDYKITGTVGTTEITAPTTSMFEWERAFMSIRTPLGLFRAGRMTAVVWGLPMFNSETQEDRIRFDTAAGPVKIGFVLHKLHEGDKGNTVSSADVNRYTGYVLYPSETVTAGLLYSYLDFKAASDIGPPAAHKSLWHVLTPFFKAKFGAFGVQGELLSITGDAQDFYDPAMQDNDIDVLNWNLEGQFNFGAGKAYLGYAVASGQDASGDDTEHNGLGEDWEGLFILAGSTGMSPGGLGNGKGNFTPTGGNDDGINLIYGGATFGVTDAITLGVAFGTGTADEVDPGWDDDLGFEVDLKLAWKFYDGAVKYSAKAAYLSAGDYWSGAPGNTTFDDSCYALYHSIQLYF